MKKVIQTEFDKGRATYGTRRLKPALTKFGWIVSRRRIGRLMGEMGLTCKVKRKFKATTNSKHDLPIAENHLKREFTVAKPNHVYVGDTSAPRGYHLCTNERRLVTCALWYIWRW